MRSCTKRLLLKADTHILIPVCSLCTWCRFILFTNTHSLYQIDSFFPSYPFFIQFLIFYLMLTSVMLYIVGTQITWKLVWFTSTESRALYRSDLFSMIGTNSGHMGLCLYFRMLSQFVVGVAVIVVVICYCFVVVVLVSYNLDHWFVGWSNAS